jgi:hypothetical protein
MNGTQNQPGCLGTLKTILLILVFFAIMGVVLSGAFFGIAALWRLISSGIQNTTGHAPGPGIMIPILVCLLLFGPFMYANRKRLFPLRLHASANRFVVIHLLVILIPIVVFSCYVQYLVAQPAVLREEWRLAIVAGLYAALLCFVGLICCGELLAEMTIGKKTFHEALRDAAILLKVGGAFLLVAVVVAYFLGAPRIPELKPFAPHLAAMSQVPDLLATNEPPHIIGRVILIERQGRDTYRDRAIHRAAGEISLAWRSLPDTVKARSPEQVGTVVIMEKERQSMGVYGAGPGHGYAVHRHIILVDWKTHAVLGRKSFRGSDPPKKIVTSGESRDAYGSDPLPDLLAYVTQLPRQ